MDFAVCCCNVVDSCDCIDCMLVSCKFIDFSFFSKYSCVVGDVDFCNSIGSNCGIFRDLSDSWDDVFSCSNVGDCIMFVVVFISVNMHDFGVCGDFFDCMDGLDDSLDCLVFCIDFDDIFEFVFCKFCIFN